MPAGVRATRSSHHRWLAADLSTTLVQAAQRGTDHELEILLTSLRPVLFGYFARRVDSAVADDLAQRALLIVARRYRHITPEGAAAWLVTVARNVVRDEYRRSSRAASHRGPLVEANGVAARELTGARAEYAELVDAVVATTRSACTEALRRVILGVLRGLEVSEIACELGITEATVRVRLTRARAILKRELREWHDGSGSSGRRRGEPSPSRYPESCVDDLGVEARAIGLRAESAFERRMNLNS
jgi:RNA polymerase sigma-70 factor (ECF subfamily)